MVRWCNQRTQTPKFDPLSHGRKFMENNNVREASAKIFQQFSLYCCRKNVPKVSPKRKLLKFWMPRLLEMKTHVHRYLWESSFKCSMLLLFIQDFLELIYFCKSLKEQIPFPVSKLLRYHFVVRITKFYGNGHFSQFKIDFKNWGFHLNVKKKFVSFTALSQTVHHTVHWFTIKWIAFHQFPTEFRSMKHQNIEIPNVL